MNIKVISWAGAFLLVGLGFGYSFGTLTESRPAPTAGEKSDSAVKASSDGDSESSDRLAKLRARNDELSRRVRELEKRLASAETAREEEKVDVAPAEKDERTDEPRREGFRERMERMKRENPEGYEEMRSRFAEFRRTRAEQANTKLGFLSSIDTSRMSPEARADHARLQEIIVAQEEVEKKLHNPDIEEDERRELFGEMMKNGAEMMELNRKERETLIRNMGEELGFDATGVAEFESTMRELLDATDLGFGVMGSPRGMRSPHGRRGGGPRGGPR